jgi:hypothetical protein
MISDLLLFIERELAQIVSGALRYIIGAYILPYSCILCNIFDIALLTLAPCGGASV